MIEQQYYTRERKGIFSKTPGYDTVAKSINLDNDFIINTLHDLCFYEAPSSLAGEKNILEYPAALFCVNAEDGRMVIGQSVFADKDYTGTRNRYFTHNYIIPKEEKDNYILNPEKIIYSTGFVSAHNIERGMIISEVSEIDTSKIEDCFSSIEEMFSATGMDYQIFVKLIKACFDGANSEKKIYIVLDSEKTNLATLAKGILKYLYRVLPFEVRRKIGFITYMKEPKIKNLINIIFLHRGSIKRLTMEIKAGYVFDLADRNFYLDEIDDENNIFIDFAINNIENKEILDEFFYEADKIITEDRMSIYQYDNFLKPLEGKEDEALNYLEHGEISEQKELNKTYEEKEYVEDSCIEFNEDKKGDNTNISSLSIWKKAICFSKKIKDILFK